MATKRYRHAMSTWFLVFCVAGCVGPTESKRAGNSMPEGWSVVLLADPNICASIDGDYQILGLGKLTDGSSVTETRLDVALGHTFPTNGMPKRVSISIDKGANMLNFQFGDPTNLDFSERVSCFKGWYTFEQSQTDQYVGDGATLDYANRIVELGKANDGSLIVHLILEAQFSSFSVLKSHETEEVWSKYNISN
jgi:hypothetical protein